MLNVVIAILSTATILYLIRDEPRDKFPDGFLGVGLASVCVLGILTDLKKRKEL